MYQNYFVIDGTRYYTGTVFIVRNMGKEEEATFICYDTSRNKYVYKIRDCKHHMDETIFMSRFIGVTNKVSYTTTMPVSKTKKGTDVGGLFLGWIWYVVLMAVSVIFNEAIWLWILISIVFFGWRSKKIKEEGTYIEW